MKAGISCTAYILHNNIFLPNISCSFMSDNVSRPDSTAAVAVSALLML